MTDRLILLTSVYPCASGEEFLEAEISYLSRRFNDIVIIPTYLRGQSEVATRPLPSNCRLVIPVPSDDPHVRPLARRISEAAKSPMVGSPLSPHTWALDMRFAVTSMSLFDRVARALVEAGVDPEQGAVIYSYWLFKPAAVAIELRDRYFKGKAVAVSRAHRYDVYPDQGIFGHLPAREHLVSSLDMMFPISESARQAILDVPGARPSSVEVARLGVSAAVSQRTRKLDQPVHIVSCSSLAPVKRVDLIVQAMRLVNERMPHAVKWTHIGDSGPESLEELRSEINAAGISDFAEAIGRKTNAEVLNYYREENVNYFLNFSSSEGVPVSIMEALAHSIPVIATDVGGTSEIVSSGDNGFLLSAHATPEDLAATIERAVGIAEETYADMSHEALTTWAEFSDADAQYEAFSQHLEELSRTV